MARVADAVSQSGGPGDSGSGVNPFEPAALLKQQGYDVIGVTLQLYDHGKAMHRAGACCAGQDIQDAKRVAEHLGIPHYVLDYESRFK
ncbi:MAG TPA: tRNA 2-thiouridine(34) synthase MnmA, partial [Rhizobiales bacterium]|nr:tRNA 2-thiouridine(34) synthase MnmA [Hyphomicrobiales bacterium]